MTISKAKTNEVGGSWPKCRSYGTVNGCVMPASPSVVSYDPWTAFRSNQGRYRTVDQPYASLLALHRTLTNLEAAGIVASSVNSRSEGSKNEADEAILTWCDGNGLLGLLPGLSESLKVKSGSQEYHRLGGSWEVLTGGQSADSRVGAQWLDLYSHRRDFRPIEDIHVFHAPTWRSQTNQIATMECPLSAGFWDSYCEPLLEIAYWAGVFHWCVKTVSQWPAAGNNEGLLDVRRAYRTLMGLALPIAPTFEFNPKRNSLDEVRYSPSLLSSFALMFLWDRAEGRRAVACENCELIFISNEKRARYCSPPCRNRANVRKSKSTAASRAQGGVENGK